MPKVSVNDHYGKAAYDAWRRGIDPIPSRPWDLLAVGVRSRWVDIATAAIAEFRRSLPLTRRAYKRRVVGPTIIE